MRLKDRRNCKLIINHLQKAANDGNTEAKDALEKITNPIEESSNISHQDYADLDLGVIFALRGEYSLALQCFKTEIRRMYALREPLHYVPKKNTYELVMECLQEAAKNGNIEAKNALEKIQKPTEESINVPDSLSPNNITPPNEHKITPLQTNETTPTKPSLSPHEATNESPENLFYLGLKHYHGQGGTPQNYKMAVQYWQQAAIKGCPTAEHNLGYCYANGRGIDQDNIMAVKHYQSAADQGNAQAQYRLAECYETGRGVIQNYQKAVEYYQLAADQGNAHAQYKLAECYENGRGVEKDAKIAKYYYHLSAGQGNKNAKEILNTIKIKLNPNITPSQASLLVNSSPIFNNPIDPVCNISQNNKNISSGVQMKK